METSNLPLLRPEAVLIAGNRPEVSWVGIGLAVVTLATMPPLAHA